MMRQIQIYIEGERLELFSDETITINSTIQNYKDLSKLFTDFSQTFNVPATPHNNAIFEHFYQTDVNGVLNYQQRRAAKIEIDTLPFRTGKLQLEKANVKNGQPYSYSITFYGDIRSLADLFGDDKLASLDLSAYSHNYTGTEVRNRIANATNYDVRYPLISSNRLWSYGDNTNTDISKNSSHIHYTELFPALRIARLFDAIASTYGLTFQGAFLQDKRFTNCYMWLKNADTFEFSTNPQELAYSYSNSNSVISTTTGLIYLQHYDVLSQDTTSTHSIGVKITSVSNSVTKYYIDLIVNNQLVSTTEGSGVAQYNVYEVANDAGLNQSIKIRIRANNSITINSTVIVVRKYQTINPLNNTYATTTTTYTGTAYTLNLTGSISLVKTMPDMLIKDFIAGILKEFNMICYGVNPSTFKFQTLEEWYGTGEIVDYTKYTITDSIDYERIKLFKRISFGHEESKSFMNVRFKENNNREYGSLEQAFDYDGEEYVIKLPFENLLHQKFTSTNLQVGYALEANDYRPYIPKPVLLYMYDQQACSFYFNNGATTTQVTTYMPFGQDLYYNFSNLSLNFGNDISSLLEVNIPRGLYQEHYSGYILNLYQAKNRLVYVKMNLPVTKLTRLKLNDRIVIRDKRYIINEMKTNLTNGDVDFVLMLDFRYVKPRERRYIVPIDGGEVAIPWSLPNGVSSVSLAPPAGVSINPTLVEGEEIVTFSIPANADEIDLFVTEASEQYVYEDYINARSEYGNDVVYTIEVTETYEDGTTNIYDYNIIQAG